MKIVIIPSHNQSKYIEQIIRSYEKQTLRPDFILFVFDRCTDDSEKVFKNIVTDLHIDYVIKDIGDNFSAGMTRDYGVSVIETRYPNYDMILFTDGDCIPNETVIEDHYGNCNLIKTPIVSCGRRMTQEENGSWTEDERMDNWAKGKTFVNYNSRVILSSKMALDTILTYSCNLAFNKAAIDLCKSINLYLTNSNRVFNPEFDGSWGGEDNFISDCLYRTGNHILLTNYRSTVKHYWHKKSPKHNIKHTIWKSLSERLKFGIINNHIYGPVSIFESCTMVRRPSYLETIQNISKVIKNTTTYNSLLEILSFSRNYTVVKPIHESLPNINLIEYVKSVDSNSFRKFSLTSNGIIENTDWTEYSFYTGPNINNLFV